MIDVQAHMALTLFARRDSGLGVVPRHVIDSVKRD
jgi:hypothetical protein